MLKQYPYSLTGHFQCLQYYIGCMYALLIYETYKHIHPAQKRNHEDVL